MNRPVTKERWLPRSLVSFCQQVPLETFLKHYADAYFLVIRLWERDDALTNSLMSRAPELSGVDAPSGPHASTVKYEAVTSLLSAGQSGAGADNPGISSEIRGDLCFVMAIRRSALLTDTAPITLGRSRSCAVWLQHRSISQVHAWFEFDADGHLYLTDADSKNKTTLDGQRVKDQPAPVENGSAVMFGALRSTVCAPEVVWTALASQSGVDCTI